MKSEPSWIAKWRHILLRSVVCGGVAAGLAVIVYLLIGQVSVPIINDTFVPAIIAVPVAVYVATGWKKGFKQLKR